VASKVKPTQLMPPKRIELEYQKKLYRWIRFVTQFMQENIRPFLREWVEQGTRQLRGDSVHMDSRRDIDRVFQRLEQTSQEMFGQAWQETISYETAATTNNFNADRTGKAIKRVLGVDVLATEPWLIPRVEAFVSTNADLITSLQREHIAKLKFQVTNVVEKGITGADFAKEIERQFGTELAKATNNVQARARLIARDQVSKFNGKLTETRQTAAGFTHYIWSTSGDERVRESHRMNNGKKFSWAEPPAETGHPGSAVNCRCVALPIMTQDMEKDSSLRQMFNRR
jgi:SPP1 gp7 family putative phage head morphogenesis protein